MTPCFANAPHVATQWVKHASRNIVYMHAFSNDVSKLESVPSYGGGGRRLMAAMIPRMSGKDG